MAKKGNSIDSRIGDIIGGFVQNAKGVKEELVKSLRDEINSQISNIDTAKLIDEIIKKYDIELNTTIKFKERSVQTKKKYVKKDKKNG